MSTSNQTPAKKTAGDECYIECSWCPGTEENNGKDAHRHKPIDRHGEGCPMEEDEDCNPSRKQDVADEYCNTHRPDEKR